MNYSEFFTRNGVKPDDLSAAQWTDMSATAYHIIVSMLGDAKMQHIIAGVPIGDGAALLKKLKAIDVRLLFLKELCCDRKLFDVV